MENIIREPVLSDIALEYRKTRQEGFISSWQQFFFVPRWRKSNYASPAKGFSSLRVLLDQRISCEYRVNREFLSPFRHIIVPHRGERGGIFVLFLIISYPLKSFRTNKIFILVFSPVAFPRKWELSSGELKKKKRKKDFLVHSLKKYFLYGICENKNLK